MNIVKQIMSEHLRKGGIIAMATHNAGYSQDLATSVINLEEYV